MVLDEYRVRPGTRISRVKHHARIRYQFHISTTGVMASPSSSGLSRMTLGVSMGRVARCRQYWESNTNTGNFRRGERSLL